MVLVTGGVRCVGYNGFGMLGDGTKTSSSSPVDAAGISNAVQVEVSESHTCARLADGTMKCWGENWAGQLGDGTKTQSSSPRAVLGLSSVKDIALALYTTCALMSDGTTIKCFGDFSRGKLGDPAATTGVTPVTVVW